MIQPSLTWKGYMEIKY